MRGACSRVCFNSDAAAEAYTPPPRHCARDDGICSSMRAAFSGVRWLMHRPETGKPVHVEGKMRKLIILLAAAAAILAVGTVAFEANATIGAGTQGLPAGAKPYSQIEKVSCGDQGMFCPKGATLQCDPLCVCVSCSHHWKPHKHKA